MEVKTIPLNVEQNKFGMSMCVTQRERERDSVFKCEFKTKWSFQDTKKKIQEKQAFKITEKN